MRYLFLTIMIFIPRIAVASDDVAPTAARKAIPDRLVVLTFDDSSQSHYTVVRPILKQYGFGATFFITEGFDFKVLLGAKELLEQGRIRFLQFEYNANWVPVGHSLLQATSFLERYGYRIYLIRSTGVHSMRYDFWGDYYRYSNYFACKSCDLDAIGALLMNDI